MNAPRAVFIPELFETHVEELTYLGAQRRAAWTSPRHTVRSFADLQARLDAHLQGTQVVQPAYLLAQLQPRLVSADRDEACASAWALLASGQEPAVRAVLEAFAQAAGDTLYGLRDALGLVPMGPLALAALNAALLHAQPATAVAAAVVLANHRQLDATHGRLPALLADDDALVQAWAWRAAHLADVLAAGGAPPRPVKAGVTHAHAWVRDAAWQAAAWSAFAQTLPGLRQMVQRGDEVAIQWLAILGQADDVPVIQQWALAQTDPTLRCGVLARFGHPSALPALVRWMADGDVSLAVAARRAFTRITGVDVRGQRGRLPVPDGADDFAREMAPDVWLPDVARAHDVLVQRQGQWSQGIRWCAGRSLASLPPEVLPELDLQTRWDQLARAALAGAPVGLPRPIV